MITIKDINKAIVTQVKSRLLYTNYKSVEFQSTDIKEGITRPSFYIEFGDIKTGLFNAFNIERNVEIRLYYFPSDRTNNKIELLEMQMNLELIFLRYLMVNEGFFFDIEELDFDITADGVLITTFNLHSVEELPSEDENTELMEELIINDNLIDDFNI